MNISKFFIDRPIFAGVLSTLIFLGGLMTGPFAIVVGVVAFVIAMLFMLVLASRVADRGRPKWPWERDDE